MPPKRKAVMQLKREDSELTPPPEDLADAKPVTTKVAVNGSSPGKKRKVKKEVVEGGEKDKEDTPKKKKAMRERATKVKVEAEVAQEPETDANAGADETPKSKGKRKAVKKEAKAEDDGEDGDVKTVKKKRQSKADKEADLIMNPLAARTVGHKLFIGAHVSASGGVHNAIMNSVHIGANAFALFLKSQRKWANPDLIDDHCTAFHANCKEHKYEQGDHVVPHGSYLVNLAHTEQARIRQAYDSYLDDLKRCERLGIKLYNIHPGNNQCNDRPKAIAQLAKNINRAHAATSTVITLLENMAAGGNVLGSTFEDLRDIIAKVDNKDRIGVCIDTCHAFAGGYDLRTPEAFEKTFEDFDTTVGFKYLRAMHINDSKAPFDSHRDLHANIGTGFLGLRAFHNLVNDERFQGLPLVLETPIDVRDDDGNIVKDEKGKDKEDKAIWAREIKMLENLVGMDVEGEDFLELEKKLQRQGEPERKRLMEQVDKKKEKDSKKQSKLSFGRKEKTPKKKKKGEESEDEGESD
ncbi:putative AP endonuclease 2, xylose isomerase-like, TIM barrel domain-containing protein [Septoria linicola]|nr:putative AP endonuclease 2, xylose isomerase-like, TIM barrel domain-containing protein [Septoria linicola]